MDDDDVLQCLLESQTEGWSTWALKRALELDRVQVVGFLLENQTPRGLFSAEDSDTPVGSRVHQVCVSESPIPITLLSELVGRHASTSVADLCQFSSRDYLGEVRN